MNYASIKYFDTADGEGIRTALYVSGCELAANGNPCKGCHNSIAWDFNYGKKYDDDAEKKILDSLNYDYISGFSLLGGEPLSKNNIPTEINLLKKIKEAYPEKDIWMWTGYDSEKWSKENNTEIFNYIDWIVDGPFVLEFKNPNLKFKGSENQRVIPLSARAIKKCKEHPEEYSYAYI